MHYTYVALLRGVNVGGNNIIKMADLKTCFEGMGFNSVSTFIQSGNVIFSSAEKNKIKLEAKLEKVLAKRFNYKATVVIVSAKDIKAAVNKAPKGFGSKSETYRYDVIFLKSPLTAQSAFTHIKLKAGVDNAATGPGVLYFWRLIAKASQSQLVKILQTPIYKNLTIRNWNTTSKLAEMAGKKENNNTITKK